MTKTKDDLIEQYEAAARRWEEFDNQGWPAASRYFRSIAAHVRKHGREPNTTRSQELYEKAVAETRSQKGADHEAASPKMHSPG